MSAGAGNNLVAKNHHDSGTSVVERVENGVIEVEFGVGKRICHWLLRACEHNGFLAILDEVGEGSSGICHGIGAVKDNKAVVGIVRLNNGVSNLEPVLRTHIGAVDIHDLFEIKFAEVMNKRDVG